MTLTRIMVNVDVVMTGMIVNVLVEVTSILVKVAMTNAVMTLGVVVTVLRLHMFKTMTGIVMIMLLLQGMFAVVVAGNLISLLVFGLEVVLPFFGLCPPFVTAFSSRDVNGFF